MIAKPIRAAMIVSLVGACVTTGNQCDGWRPITMKAKTAAYINANDDKAADGVLGHNEFGERLGCWAAGNG